MIWIYLYVAVIILALVTEFLTSDMVSVWFCGGGIISVVLAAVGVAWYVHLPIFIVVSVTLILCFRKIVLKFFDKGETRTNAEAVIGNEYELLSETSFNQPGTIKINDVVWNVVTENDKDRIEKGAVVKIVCLKGNKYIVEEVK